MKILFWDWNGTIVNDAPVLCDAFNVVIASRGATPVSLEQYRELYRHPIQEMYEAVGIDFSLHSYDEMAHEWHAVYQNYRPSITLHHDSLTALETFRRRGARQMILSALPQEHLHSSAHQFGVADYFERIVGVSDNRGQGKRAEGAWLLQETGAPASDVTIIGDSSHDAEIARELRLNCILVARGAESRSRLETHGYPVHESLDALLSQITIG